MNKNEEIFQKLRDFRMEKMIELKNSENEENFDIEDVIYCGQLDFEVSGEIQKKDIFLMKKEINGEIKWEYYADGDMIAIDYNEMIIPTSEYQNVDFKPIIKNEDKQVSLNELEIERQINYASNANKEDTKSTLKIDNKTGDMKYINELDIKDEFDPSKSITTTETLGSLVPELNKYYRIAVIAPKDSNNKYEFVGITKDGRYEKLKSLVPTEGTSPTENINSSNITGSVVKDETVSSMYKIDDNQGLTIDVGVNGLEVSYYRRDSHDEYIKIPMKTTKSEASYSNTKKLVDSKLNSKYDIERSNNLANIEEKEHATYVKVENIDDNLNNDIGHDDILKTENGEEKKYEEVIDEIEKEYKVSRKEAERLIIKNRDEGETYEKVKSDIEEEINEQLRIPNR